jgi:CRISPR-associated protein Csx16
MNWTNWVAQWWPGQVWWIEGALDLVVFSGGVALALHGWNYLFSGRYRGWKLEIHESERSTPFTANIYEEDVRRFLDSDYEYWKFVKSSLSTYCRIANATMQAAVTAGWLRPQPSATLRARDKTIVIRRLNVPPGHLDRKAWYEGCEPAGWRAKHYPTPKRTLIVTRHAGAVAWLKVKGYSGEIVDDLDPKQVVEGDLVVGTLPIHIAAALLGKPGVRYLHLAINTPLGQRGRELTPAEMDSGSARLTEYTTIG